VWHLLFGMHAIPAVHGVHVPLLHTFPVPQIVPAGAFPATTHMGAPLVHSIAPALQASGAEHGASIMHEMQLPEGLQTLSFPQAVPGAIVFPVSTQVAIPPAQLRRPL
jgi:hypothetical protein